MVRQEETRSGRTLFPKLRVIIMSLSPPSHARVLLGLPPLLGNFRLALAWAFDSQDSDVGRMALPTLRANVADVDSVLYALAVASPHDGRRLSILRLLALRLHDLPGTDATDNELLAALAQPVDDTHSFQRERGCLLADAARALAVRSALPATSASRAPAETPPVDARRTMTELVRLAAESPRFERFCERLPATTSRLAGEGATNLIVGILHGLHATSGPARAIATAAIARVVTPTLTARLLDDLEQASGANDAVRMGELGTMVRVVASVSPNDVWSDSSASKTSTSRRCCSMRSPAPDQRCSLSCVASSALRAGRWCAAPSRSCRASAACLGISSTSRVIRTRRSAARSCAPCARSRPTSRRWSCSSIT